MPHAGEQSTTAEIVLEEAWAHRRRKVLGEGERRRGMTTIGIPFSVHMWAHRGQGTSGMGYRGGCKPLQQC